MSEWRKREADLNRRAAAAQRGEMVHESKGLWQIKNPETGVTTIIVSPLPGKTYRKEK